MENQEKKKPERQRRSWIMVAVIVGAVFLCFVVFFFATQKIIRGIQGTQVSISKDLKKIKNNVSDLKDEFSKNLQSIREEQKNALEVQQDQSDELTQTMSINLYYYNLTQDTSNDCSGDAVMPVSRKLPASSTFIQDTIEKLIQGELTDQEVLDGFTTEFPHPEFRLIGTHLREGVLTLEFTNPLDFTTGGACRVGILRSQIEKTALQFHQVSSVELIPEELFQP